MPDSSRMRMLFFVTTCFLVAGQAGSTYGQNRFFNGGGDSMTWSDATNWSGNDAPDTVTESAFIGSDGSATPHSVDITAPVDVRSITLGGGATIEINAETNTTGDIRVSNGILSVAANLNVSGNNGTTIRSGTLNLNAGILTGRLFLNDTFAAGVSTVVNRNGGLLDLTQLTIDGNTSITIETGDRITSSLSLDRAATVTVDASLTLAGALEVTDSTLNLNQDLVAGNLRVRGSTSNVNRAVGVAFNLQSLSVGDSAKFTYTGADSIANGVSIDNGSEFTSTGALNVAGQVNASNGSTVTLGATTTVNNLAFLSGSILNIDAATLTASNRPTAVVIRDSTLNINSDLTLGGSFGGASIAGSTLNLNAGTLTGGLSLTSAGGAGNAVVNRSGGLLNLTNLSINGNTSLTIGASDNISDSILLENGANLTLDKSLNLAESITVTDSTLNFSQRLVAEGLNITGATTRINRGLDGVFDVASLGLDNGVSYTFDGSDTITESVSLRNGSDFTAVTELNLTGSIRAAFDSTLNIDAVSNVGSISAGADSTLNINASTTLASGLVDAVAVNSNSILNVNADLIIGGSFAGTRVESSTLNLNSGTITGRLILDDGLFGSNPAAVLNQNGGKLDLTRLSVDGNTNVSIGVNDNVSEAVALSGGAVLTVDKNLNLSRTFGFVDSTVNLNQNLVADTLSIAGASSTLNRSPGVVFAVNDLNLNDNISYIFDGSDSINESVSVRDRSEFTANAMLNVASISASNESVLSLDAATNVSSLSVNANSTININAATTAGSSSFRAISIGGSSTLNVNADLAVIGSGGSTNIGRGSTLNLNNGTLSGGLFLGDPLSNFGAVTYNRNGGRLDLTNLVIADAISLTIGSSDNVSDSLSLSKGAILTVDKTLDLARSFTVNGATVNLNQDLVADRLRFIGSSNEFNRSGASLDLKELRIEGASSLAIGANDRVSNSISLRSGASLTLNKSLNLSGTIDVRDSTLNLNDNIVANGLSISGASTNIVRAQAASFDVQDLTLNNNTSYIFDGTDLIAKSVSVNNGSSFTVSSSLSVTGSISATNSSTVNVDANLATTGPDSGTIIESGTLKLNAGVLSGDLILNSRFGLPSVVEQNGGLLALDSLLIVGNTTLTLGSGDSVADSIGLLNEASVDVLVALYLDSVDLASASSLNLVQAIGQTDGLSIDDLALDSTASLSIEFDSIRSDGLDFGLQWSGDRRTELQGLIDSGRITFSGGPQSVGIIYDPVNFGDQTYLGYVSVAVPEPSSLVLTSIAILALVTSRRRLRPTDLRESP